MNSNPHNPLAPESVPVAVSGSVSSSAEETLRLIASLPAPAGLEDRVHAALRSARQFRPASGLAQTFETAKRLDDRDWMRTAAAAAIVFVVAGGGWGVYTHVQNVQQGQPAKVIVMPRVIAAGRFLRRRGHAHPADPPRPDRDLARQAAARAAKVTKKPAARPAPAKAATAQATPAATPAPQPAASK